LPGPDELKLLEPYRDRLAPEVFGEPFSPPVTDGTGRNRENLLRARKLLDAAGFGEGGRVLDVEILTFEPSFERIINPYVANLKKIGINVSLRRVDPAQYERRMKSFDFDMTTQRYSLQLQSCGHQGSRHRRARRQGDRSEVAGRAVDGNARHRPRASRRPLLGATLVQGLAQHCVLEQVLASRGEAQVRPRRDRHLVVR
jgi:hypothetical protein